MQVFDKSPNTAPINYTFRTGNFCWSKSEYFVGGTMGFLWLKAKSDGKQIPIGILYAPSIFDVTN